MEERTSFWLEVKIRKNVFIYLVNWAFKGVDDRLIVDIHFCSGLVLEEFRPRLNYMTIHNLIIIFIHDYLCNRLLI